MKVRIDKVLIIHSNRANQSKSYCPTYLPLYCIYCWACANNYYNFQGVRVYNLQDAVPLSFLLSYPLNQLHKLRNFTLSKLKMIPLCLGALFLPLITCGGYYYFVSIANATAITTESSSTALLLPLLITTQNNKTLMLKLLQLLPLLQL